VNNVLTAIQGSGGLLSDVAKVLTGLLVPLIIYLTNQAWNRIKFRKVRNFWRWFIGKQIDIVVTEYDAESTLAAPEAQIALLAGGRFLVSRSMARASSTLEQFLTTKVTKREDVYVIGDKSNGAGHYQHTVIIGSPANNNIARSVFESLSGQFAFPWHAVLDSSSGHIYFQHKDGGTLQPQVLNGQGTDYAMIVRAKMNFAPYSYIIILAGAYMYGSEAAAKAVINVDVIRSVAKYCGNAENVMFLLKLGVNADRPLNAEIFFDDEFHVYPLTPQHKRKFAFPNLSRRGMAE
jgi:hypothetical protein